MQEDIETPKLEQCLPAGVRALLKEAAELQGRTLSDFVIDAAREAAELAIARSGEVQLTRAEQKRFAEAILNPPTVAPALRQAMKHRERLLDPS